ncbi:TonB-dependent receptor [Thalassotalea mangrovi]|nr:TonB-dependent receptor [Thalassotalea mangrovi]
MSSYNNKFKLSLVTSAIVSAMALVSQQTAAQEEAQAVNTDDIEVIEISGIRGSLVKSINDKRYAESVVDTINATDIGKLPDVTIADSLQRITGIQISRSGGEGSSVNIRGIPQVMTTLNGEQMLSAGSVTTVQPDFADIPSTLVSGLEVIKSPQAKTLTGGISGTINLKTNRPLALDEGATLLGKVEVVDGSLGDDTDTKLSAFAGYNLNSTTGFSLSLSHDNVHLADYLVGSSGVDWGFNASEASNFVTENVDANMDGDTNDVYYAFQGHQASNRFIERERTGVNLSFQHDFNDSLNLTADVFYTEMEEHQYQAGFIASQAWQGVTGWFTPDAGGATPHENIVMQDGQLVEVEGNYYSFNSGELQARRTMVHSETWAIDKEALNTNLELAYDNGDDLSFNVRWVHGEARNDTQTSFVDAYVNSGSQVGATYKGAGGEPISDVNPWGYDGVLATLPDGSEVEGSYTQIPIGIAYTSDRQIWSLPMMDVVEADGSITTEAFGSNVDRYSVTSSFLDGNNSNADLDVLRLDGSYNYELWDVNSFDFGIRYGVRNIEKSAWRGVVARTNAYGDAFLAHWKDSASQAPDTLESYIDPIAFTDPLMDGRITQISDFHGSSGLGSLYFVDPRAMKNPLAYHQEVYGTIVQAPQSSGTYDLEEVTSTLYFQANFAGDVFGMDYNANAGLRYIKTEYDINQTETGSGRISTFNGQDYIVDGALGAPAPLGPQLNTERDYDDLLPAVNFRLSLSDEQVLRFAYAKTMTSHNTDNLAGGITVNRTLACNVQGPSGASVFCATGANQSGNPYLDPWRSSNFDLSYEWYFSDSGLFSLAAFYLDIESFIINTTEMLPVPDSDGQVRGYDLNTGDFTGLTPVTTIANGSGGSIKGLEIGYQQGFDFLDGFLSGFGVTANYTYSPSESGFKDYYGDDTPMSDNSEHQSNLAIWYEKYGFQARIAHNYRSEKFMWIVNKDPYKFARYQAPTHYLDASVSYDFTDYLTVSLQGTNLTEEHQEQYLQWEDLVDKRFYNERRVSLGVQVKM